MGDPWPQPGEPLYTDDDTAEILDFLDFEDSLCSGCHHPKAETFDVANTWSYKGVALQCHACAATRRAERKISDAGGIYSYAVRLDHVE